MTKLQTKKTLLKVISLLLSIFIWVYVLSSAKVEIDKTVLVNVILPDGYVLKDANQLEINFTIKGQRAFVRNYVSRLEKVQYDLTSSFDPKKKKYRVRARNLLPVYTYGVDLIIQNDQFIKVEIDKKISKKVAVSLRTYGEIPDDHKLLYMKLEPNEVKITGAQSILKNIKQVETVDVNLSELVGRGKKDIFLAKQNSSFVEYSAEKVDFLYSTKPTRVNMVFKDIPIMFLAKSFNFVSNTRSVNLLVLVDDNEKAEKDIDKIKVIAELGEAKSTSQRKVKLRAQLPDGMHLLEIQPSEILITQQN